VIQWEYRHYIFERGDNVIEIMNRLGGEGWEAFYFVNSGAKVLFKRQRAAQPEKTEKSQ
jgi:hypothetical protein